MTTIIYAVGGLMAAVAVVTILAMIVETIRTAVDDDHIGNWFD